MPQPPSDLPAASEPDGALGEALRRAMRRVASPVVIVTTGTPGGPRRGATIGSFTSVSLEPALVSFNVQSGTRFDAVLKSADALAVHPLGADQADLAEWFARPDLADAEQFADLGTLDWQGVPVLDLPTPALRAHIVGRHAAGDHTVVLARIESVAPGEPADPLLYFDRTYRTVGRRV